MSEKKTSEKPSKKAAKRAVRERKPVLAPSVCVDHDLDNYYIQVELPGVKKEDVELSVSDTSFCVKGPRKDIVLLGCYVLAHYVKEDGAKAKFDNGLLEITVPLKKPLKGKKIPIE